VAAATTTTTTMTWWTVSHSCACIGSPCLRHCVHGDPIGALDMVEQRHFEAALQQTRRSVSVEEVARYDALSITLQQGSGMLEQTDTTAIDGHDGDGTAAAAAVHSGAAGGGGDAASLPKIDYDPAGDGATAAAPADDGGADGISEAHRELYREGCVGSFVLPQPALWRFARPRGFDWKSPM
jgi:hypothetical protein